MEEKVKKCSLIEHKEIDALFFCLECKIYMCNECEKYHSKILKNHHLNKFDKNKNISFEEIFIGLCQKENHLDEL